MPPPFLLLLLLLPRTCRDTCQQCPCCSDKFPAAGGQPRCCCWGPRCRTHLVRVVVRPPGGGRAPDGGDHADDLLEDGARPQLDLGTRGCRAGWAPLAGSAPLLGALQEPQEDVAVDRRQGLPHGACLQGRHDRHREQHACRAPDPAEEGYAEEDDHWVHLHVVVALDELHLEHVPEEELQAELPAQGNRQRDPRILQPPVKQDDGRREDGSDEGAHLGYKVQEEGAAAEDHREVNAQHVQQEPDARRVDRTDHALQQDVALEEASNRGIDLNRVAQPEYHIQQHHDNLHEHAGHVLHRRLQERAHALLQRLQGIRRNFVHHGGGHQLGDPCHRVVDVLGDSLGSQPIPRPAALHLLGTPDDHQEEGDDHAQETGNDEDHCEEARDLPAPLALAPVSLLGAVLAFALC
mmetsp:Transcript_103003/g.317813  ORF Transcript_103003/g.317813 Transcript_103003/m.317813 type:complete len:408 (-) Transcript_103003:408-1631(-)